MSPNRISAELEDKIITLHLDTLSGAQKLSWILAKKGIIISSKTIAYTQSLWFG